MNSDSDYLRGNNDGGAMVAAFGSRDLAHQAAKRLREEGFDKIWIGVTSADNTLKSDDDSIGGKIGRFFSGEKDGESLTETLTRHGVSEADALRIEGSIEPSDVLLTVNGSNHPELAAQIIEDLGGDVLSGESFVYTTVDWTGADDQRGSQLLGYEDPNQYARGQRVDDGTLSRLRSDRLQTDTVPTLREDIFIFGYDDDDGDDADVTGDEATRSATGRRSAGAAIGTQHRED